MKSYKQFREERTEIDRKRQELLKSRDKATRDFDQTQRQDEIKRTIKKNKDETDMRLNDMEMRREREMHKLRKDIGL